MYTEISFGAKLKSDTPQEVIDTIQHLVNGEHDMVRKTAHPFFQSGRSWLLTSQGSYYFAVNIPPSFTFDGAWSLYFRTSVKNYDDEIEKFLDWIKPYIAQGSGEREMYAVVIYEEAEEPTIYYLHEKGEA
jgi:hypothetical protein